MGRSPEPEFHTCDGAAMTPDKQSEPPARRALREAEGLLFENSRCTTSDVPIGAGRSIHTIQLKLRDDERGAPSAPALLGPPLDETLSLSLGLANASFELGLLWALRSEAWRRG